MEIARSTRLSDEFYCHIFATTGNSIRNNTRHKVTKDRIDQLFPLLKIITSYNQNLEEELKS